MTDTAKQAPSELERLRSALKKLFALAETPNPEAWPNGYGAYWNYRRVVMCEAEAALREGQKGSE